MTNSHGTRIVKKSLWQTVMEQEYKEETMTSSHGTRNSHGTRIVKKSLRQTVMEQE
jgi:hypothetical protein